VQALLDSGSDGNLVFINKDKPMLLPSSKRLVPQLWNTLNGMFQTKRKAEIELNFFEYSNSKRYLADPDIWSVLQEQDEYQVPSTAHKMISKQKGRTPLTFYLKLIKIK
jgi:hypothetical protein